MRLLMFYRGPKSKLSTVEDAGGVFNVLRNGPSTRALIVYSGAPVGFDICFQRLAQHTAVLMPSSPTTIMGLRSSASHIIDQWWALAKRYVFRTWSYLLNSGTGVFLVKSCVKTHRFAACLSRGTQGQLTQIRIHGMTALTANADQIDLTAAGTTWIPYRNDLGFEFHDSGGQQEYTVFIKRDASRMFTLTDVTLKEAAHRVWMYFLH